MAFEISPIMGDIFDVLLYVFVGALVVGMAYFIYFIVSHKYYITVKHLTGGKKIVIRDRARIVKDKKGVKKLKLWKGRERIPFPPDEVADVTNRGKVYASCYRTQAGQYIWILDHGLKKGVTIPEGSIAEDFEPMNTIDREFYANEWEESERYSKNRIWQNLPQIVALLIPLVLFVVVVVYWEEIAAPVKEMQQINTAAIEKANEVLDKASAIIGQIEGTQTVQPKEKPG